MKGPAHCSSLGGSQRRPVLPMLSVLLLTVLTVLLFDATALQAEEKDTATVVEVSGQKTGNMLAARIKGDSSLTYTSYELFNPTRVVVDVANAQLQPGVSLNLPDDEVRLQSKEIVDAEPQILRFEFLLEKSLPHTIRQDGDAILVLFDLKGEETPPVSATPPLPSQKNTSTLTGYLPETGHTGAASARPVSNKLQDDFSFSGYDRERISVDFYKMDLHNVFRFLREISGVNIIVDESVQGMLTLSLDHVPWDFALDIILNLKDLRQEERFNTIVIFPKNKEFLWPGKAEGTLSFQADESLAHQEALVITQIEQQPAGLVEAAQLIAKGNEFEKQHNPVMAVEAYEQAFEQWSSNAKLANRISAIYLVELRQNAKALHYAKQALALDETDSIAALNAAIASVNMRDMRSAEHYFDLSTQGAKPGREALLSYALFREENKQYDQALQILDRHNTLYGNDLDAMIATARVYDKQGAGFQAVQEYRSILNSGFSLPPDLSRFIRARIGMVD